MFIYRRKTSRGLCKYWSVKFTGADGHQVLRSTKQQNKDKAREVALAWDKVARLALNGTLTHAASQALFKRASDRNFRREFQCSDGQRLFRILAGSQADNRQSFRHSEALPGSARGFRCVSARAPQHLISQLDYRA